ncbi:hypothetical protein B0H13DRAFT_1851301 [Mycena leptocephala]|nr:hypothetical protein B0H13DRAFT_1851301 [Mycena leptocephala]
MDQLFLVALAFKRPRSLTQADIDMALESYKTSDAAKVHREIRSYANKATFAQILQSNKAEEKILSLFVPWRQEWDRANRVEPPGDENETGGKCRLAPSLTLDRFPMESETSLRRGRNIIPWPTLDRFPMESATSGLHPPPLRRHYSTPSVSTSSPERPAISFATFGSDSDDDVPMSSDVDDTFSFLGRPGPGRTLAPSGHATECRAGTPGRPRRYVHELLHQAEAGRSLDRVLSSQEHTRMRPVSHCPAPPPFAPPTAGLSPVSGSRHLSGAPRGWDGESDKMTLHRHDRVYGT